MKGKFTSQIDSLTTTAPQNIAQQDAVSFDVYRKLREDIVSCRLKPNAKLRFDALRAAFGVGIGTLREALSHLVSDGLVRSEVGRGFRVAPVSLSDLVDIAEWRVEFEVRAVVESIRRGDDKWEAEIVTAFHLLSRAGLLSSDATAEQWLDKNEKHKRFHDALVASCGSPWLLYFRSVLFDQSTRYQALALILKEPMIYRSSEEHRLIMDAVLDRDEKKAAELIEGHIRRTVDVVAKDLKGSMELVEEEEKRSALSSSTTKKRGCPAPGKKPG